ncbi:MAG: hypothetical protein AAGF31_11165 [Planctomycetota bacterium]
MENTWRVDGAIAKHLETGAQLQLEAPSSGIVGFPQFDGRVFGVRPAAENSAELTFGDAYARGADLIARYQPSPGFPFRTEIYWRIEPSPTSERLLQLSLIVSVETDLLDTYPSVVVESRVPADRCQVMAMDETGQPIAAGRDQATLITADCQSSGKQYCEAVHPSDASEAMLATASPVEGNATLQWQLFSRFLEKGVIRRARLSATLITDGTEASIKAWYRRFAGEAPPLTV